MIDKKTGKIKTTDVKEDIRQSILILLSTSPGERLLHGDYGCNLRKFMFEPISFELIKAIQAEVLAAITKWEKRIYHTEVNILSDVEEETRLVISIRYIIPMIQDVDYINYIYDLQ